MHKFVRELLTEWRKLKLPFEDKTFVVAVSGGADSISLLLALHDLKKRQKLKLRFVIGHFNHNLRAEESEKDEKFVKDLAGEFGFELAIGRGQISKTGNLEQNARRARYEFLWKTAENLRAFGVLTAHTINDQAETFMLNLIRGSGLEGLGSMKSIQEFNLQNSESSLNKESNLLPLSSGILLIRPLLDWAGRRDTENFCHDKEIKYRFDKMNEDLSFKRVRVRKLLIPMLEDFNPKIIETLAQTAGLLQEDFLELQKKIHIENSLSRELLLKDLKKLSGSMRRNFLRNWLKFRRGNLRGLESKHFEGIDRLILSPKSGREIELPNGETILKSQGKLFYLKKKG